MDGTAALSQESALRVFRRPQTAAIPGAVDVLALEGRGGHPQKIGRADDIRLREIDEALLLAAGRAARLALKTQSLRHVSLWTFSTPAVSFRTGIWQLFVI
jgi:hypothetical protein